MALFTDWHNARKVLINGREVRYSCVPEYWTASDVTVRSPIFWKLTRHSSMQFQYIGMTEDGANECAKAQRREFTRKYMRWTPTVIENPGEAPTVLINHDSVVECSSSIQPNPTAGSNYHVDCQIDETDEIICDHEVTDVDEFESLFQLAEQREDTSSGGSLAIVSAKWDSNSVSIHADYNPIIPNFNPANIVVQVKGEGGVWSTAAMSQAPTAKTVGFYSDTNATFRLKYGDIVSKEFKTHDSVTPNIVVDSAFFEDTEAQHQRFVVNFRETATRFPPSTNKQAYKVKVITHDGETVLLNLQFLDTSGVSYSATTVWRSGFMTDGHSQGCSVSVVYLDDVESNSVNPLPLADVDMETPQYLGVDTARDTPTARAFKFSAAFSTSLPEQDVLAATSVMMIMDAYRITIRPEGSIAADSVVVTKVSEGRYEIRFSAVGLGTTRDIWTPSFWLSIASGGKTYRSQYSWIDVSLQNRITIDSLTETGAASAAIAFTHDIEGFNISRLKLYIRTGKDYPTSYSDDTFREASYTVDGDGRLVIGYPQGGFSALYRLEYRPASGDTIKSEVFDNNASFINLVKVEMSPLGLIATWDAGGRQVTNNRVDLYNESRVKLQFVDRNSDNSNIYSGNGSWFFLHDTVISRFSTPKSLEV